MIRRAAVSDMMLPLLTWPDDAELHLLAQQRADLAARIAKLPKHSAKRIIAEDRLQGVTRHALEVALRRQRVRS